MQLLDVASEPPQYVEVASARIDDDHGASASAAAREGEPLPVGRPRRAAAFAAARQVALALSVRADHEEPGLPVRQENDPLAVGRPGGRPGIPGAEILPPAAVRVHDHEAVGVAREAAGKKEPAPVRRCKQRFAERQFRARADAHRRPAVPADDVDAPVAVKERREDDVPLAAGRSSAARGEQETCQKQRRGSPSRAQARSLEARDDSYVRGARRSCASYSRISIS